MSSNFEMAEMASRNNAEIFQNLQVSRRAANLQMAWMEFTNGKLFSYDEERYLYGDMRIAVVGVANRNVKSSSAWDAPHLRMIGNHEIRIYEMIEAIYFVDVVSCDLSFGKTFNTLPDALNYGAELFAREFQMPETGLAFSQHGLFQVPLKNRNSKKG